MYALERMLRTVALSCVFLVPFVALIVTNSLFFPFITGKNFAFRILIEVGASAWLALALAFPHYRPRRSWMLYAFTAFLLVMAVADALGAGPLKSFWSNFERMEGWVTLAHLFLFFIVASSLLMEKLWRAWMHVSMSVAVVIAVYGLFQLAGFLTINQGGVRLDATLGNATYLAIYMVFHMFIAGLLWVRAASEGKWARTGLWFVYGGSIALFSFVLFFTATRGAILGLLGGATLSGLIYAFARPESRAGRRIFAALAVLLVLAGGVWLARDTTLVQGSASLSRLASISFSEASLSARALNAQSAWKGFSERPLLGWGQEHFAIVFDKYYDPRLFGSEPWFDRAHNVVLDWLIAGGILGLFAYITFFLSGPLCAWRSDTFLFGEKALLAGLFAAYFFYNLFTFDNITSYILFIGVLGWIHSRAAAGSYLAARFSIPRDALPALAVCAIVLAWGSAWWVNADALAQNRAILRGLSTVREGEVSVGYFTDAISYGGYGAQEAREHLAQTAMSVRGVSFPDSVKQIFLQNAASEMMKQAEVLPQNARFPLFLGVLLDTYGLHNDARAALERALELSPRKQSILFQLGQNAFARNDTEAAREFFRRAYELLPEYRDAHIFYAIALIHSGDHASADALLAPLIESGQAADSRLVGAYASRGEYGRIASLWRRHVEKNPGDMQARFTLAAALYASGDTSAAVSVLEQIGRDAPQAKAHADTVIAEMRAGTLKIE